MKISCIVALAQALFPVVEVEDVSDMERYLEIQVKDDDLGERYRIVLGLDALDVTPCPIDGPDSTAEEGVEFDNRVNAFAKAAQILIALYTPEQFGEALKDYFKERDLQRAARRASAIRSRHSWNPCS